MGLTPQMLSVLCTSGFSDFALLDSGDGRKLERFGSIIVDRPEVQALWPKQDSGVWSKAHAVFSASELDEEKGRWRVDKSVPGQWPVVVNDVTMMCRLKGLWHVGLFPEQLPHWQWMVERINISSLMAAGRPRVLNLFGYTGAATLLAAAAGADVTHVDASKAAIGWAKENQAASGLEDKPIRWMLDDASKFVAREVRRGKCYDVILVDPPKFGRGPKNEVWELFSGLPNLLKDCTQLLEPKCGAMILTVYAIRASALTFAQLMQETIGEGRGLFEAGELAILPTAGGYGVSTSLFVRWRGDV